MKFIVKWRWAVLAAWIAAAAGLFLTAPDMAELVRTKGQITMPEGYSSDIAAQLEDELNEGKEGGGGYSTVLVFHKEQGLAPEDFEAIRAGTEALAGSPAVAGITTHFDLPELEERMVSEDGTTVLALVSADPAGRTPSELREALYEALEGVPVDHYFTGSWIIAEDVIESSEEGVKKTEWITVAFITIILLLVFRSPVAPFIPLLTVGFSYIVSQSIVAYLAEYADFPLSNFTQIFLVAILFGIGTDYCILLISRFKEELAGSENASAAVVSAYRASGKTVLFAGLAVLVGFTSIGFSKFSLFQSAVAVAVGVAVLLLALLTLVPFFLATLGKAVFWPVRGTPQHKPSRLWGAAGRFALGRPLIALLVLAAVTVPFLSVYQQTVSFNSLDEIGDSYKSVKAFNLIADGFGPGETLPTTVVVKADAPFDTEEGLAAVERVTRELAQVKGVDSVRSATRPTGEPIGELRVSEQAGVLGGGLGEANDGLAQIRDGLAEAGAALGENGPKLLEAVDGIEQLVAGTNELRGGVEQLGEGLAAIEQGLRDGSAGAGELLAGLRQAQESAEQLASAAADLLGGYEQLGGGFGQLVAGYEAAAASQAKFAEGLAGVGAGLAGLSAQYPDLAGDPTFQQVQGVVAQLQTGAEQLNGALAQLNGQLAQAAAGLGEANAGLKQAADGQAALAAGLAQLADGLAALQAGIAQAADGQGQIVARLPDVSGGLDALADGQRELLGGFEQLAGQLGELTDGLNQSADGLSQVTEGLGAAVAYLNELADAPDAELSGWYMPEEAAGSEEFRMSLDTYLSLDRKLAKFEVVTAGNPYHAETMEMMEPLRDAVARGLAETPYASAEFAVGGVASMNHDLETVSSEDYTRTAVMMLIGIALILFILLRSFLTPLYLMASLVLTYFTSMAVAEVIFVRWMGVEGISWAVPFFAFVMLMALGIDYSIFLMDRFREYRDLDPREAILLAMRNMGTVIISAAVILGGTFAAMLPSGVMSLMQIAVVVLCGLLLYALVMLPLFVPVMVRVFGRAELGLASPAGGAAVEIASGRESGA